VLGYYVFVDPLRKFPGPFIAKFTGAVGGWHGWRGDFHLATRSWHQKYGQSIPKYAIKAFWNE